MSFETPLLFSVAVTFRMPLASTSSSTTISGLPQGIAGIPSRLNSPSLLQSFVIGRSPSKI
jgi:hypothetical protein